MDASHETEDLNSKCLQQTAGRGPRRRPRGGLPGTRSLERVTTIVGQPLDASRQIRVARSWPVNRRCSFGIIETAVLVGNLHHERRAPVVRPLRMPARNVAIGLDPLPGTSSVPSLTTSEFLVDEVDVEIEARWETRERTASPHGPCDSPVVRQVRVDMLSMLPPLEDSPNSDRPSLPGTTMILPCQI